LRLLHIYLDQEVNGYQLQSRIFLRLNHIHIPMKPR
jgi:hypothetical protein